MAEKTFDEILAQLSADERKLFDNTLTKYPDLKAGWLRQDDYSRQSNEVKAQKAEFETAKEYADRMRAWADVNVPRYDALVDKGIIDKETGEELWTTQKSELERQLAEANAKAVGGDMDPAELDKRVKEIVRANGGLTPDELKAVIASQAKELAAETFKEQWKEREADFNQKTIPFVAGFSAATAVVANKYEKETGESWTAEKQKELFDLMTKEQNFDPFVVGEKMLAPAKAAKAKAEEIKAAADAAVQAYRDSHRGMPGGGDEDFIPQNGPKGALEVALERSTGTTDFEATIRAQAVKAAGELAAAGKA